MSFSLTPEQEQIIAYGRDEKDSFIIDAVAGSGKSTTLVMLLNELRGASALTSFNRKAADELQAKVLRDAPRKAGLTHVKTAHAFGFQALRSVIRGRPNVQGGKMNFILKDLQDGLDYKHPEVRNRWTIAQLVSYAKAGGFGLQSHSLVEQFPAIDDYEAWVATVEHFGLDMDLTEDMSVDRLIELAQQALKLSNQNLSMIDFDDMVYLPLLLDAKIGRFTNVMIDEAQDINATRRELAFRMVKPGGRIIAVGDPCQAIYGFTGADAESLHNIAKRAEQDHGSCLTFPLSYCWRCPQVVEPLARRRVKNFTIPDTAPLGHYEAIDYDETFIDRLRPGDMVLCRLNKPNLKLCLQLVRRGKRARIEGRDIGARLLSHYRKAAPDLPKLADGQILLETYRDHQVQLLQQRDRGAAAAMLEDEVDCCQILIERTIETGGSKFADLEQTVTSLFGDNVSNSSTITMCSAHKAKGLEFPTVYIYGRQDYMPFFKAEQPWELEQEHNLIYVAQTRAQQTLIEVNNVPKD